MLKNNIVVVGHYGSGKTNLAVNLAVNADSPVSLVDLDIVNPYFRSADFRNLGEQHGFDVISSTYANSNLDIPALSAQTDALLSSGRTVILDVGGDDAGAIALGRYAPRLKVQGYTMLYVFNRFRPMTDTPAKALELLREIEGVSRLQTDYLVDNSNLAEETTIQDIIEGRAFAQELERLAGIPLLWTVVEKHLAPELVCEPIYPVTVYVKAPWDKKEG